MTTIFKALLLYNRFANQSQISHGASLERGKKVYINCTDGCHAHIRKKPSKFYSRTEGPMIFKLDVQHQGLKLYNVYINDDPGLTLTILRQGQIGSPIRLNG